MEVRPLNRDKYNISSNRFRELYYFCLQYQEWKDEINGISKVEDILNPVSLNGMPHGTGISDQTGNVGARRAELKKKCELIENTAVEADADIHKYILKAVTTHCTTFQYLNQVMGMPCGKDMYYDRRRKFYWLLSKKI